MPKLLHLNSKGFTPIITLLLVLGGIVASVYLVQHTQIFRPKAAASVLDLQVSDGKDTAGNPCTLSKDAATGRWKTNCREVKLNILSPADVGAGVTTPSTNGTACSDNPVAPLDGYKWVADCSKTCQSNDDCPKNSVQGPTGFVCPATSNYCYDFKGSVGKKCLMLEYTGPQTGGPVGRYSEQTCSDKTRPTYSCIQGPAGKITAAQADCVLKARPEVLKTYTETNKWCNTTDNQRAIVNNWINNVATDADKNDSKVKACLSAVTPQPVGDALQFVVAESEGELQASNWENYTAGGVSKIFTFTPAPTASQTRYVYLRFRQGSSRVGENFYTAVVEYVAPDGTGGSQGTGATNPAANAPANPTGANQPLTAFELQALPSTVKQNSDGSYSPIQFWVTAANKDWTLYFNNKKGANCGGTCGMDGWTPFTDSQTGAIDRSTPQRGTGKAGTDGFKWTPPSYLKGVYTVGLLDVANGKVVKTVNITFQDQSGSTGNLEGAKISKVDISKNYSGSFRPVKIDVTASEGQSWSVYYNQSACSPSCDAGIGWTKIGSGVGTNSITWSDVPAFVSGSHAIAIIDTNANKIIDSNNYNFSPTPTGDGNYNND